MLPTPDVSHLTSKDYDHVYEPAEDSFLFLDALEKEYEFLKKNKCDVCVEIGSGSGVVSTFLGTLLKPHQPLIICTDINSRASDVTRRTGDQNIIPLQPVLTDLVACFLPRLENKVDVLLFNPPYVVTPSEEVGSKGIEASWAGGVRGREVIDRFLPLIPRLLSERGICYLVVIKENDADEIQKLLSTHGFAMQTVLSRTTGPEHLSVLKFTRESSQTITALAKDLT